MVKGGAVDHELLQPITSNDPIESLVMLTTRNLNSRDDLAYLLGKLHSQASDVIQVIFSVFNEYQTILLRLMDRVWLAESQKQSPEWELCIDLYSQIMDFAKRHNLSLLFDAAARAQMIIYDEYLDNSQTALQVANEARHTITTEAHPIIDLAESTVVFRSEQPAPALDLIDSVETSLLPNNLTLERLFALRRAINVAGENQNWTRVTNYVTRGFELSESLHDSLLKQVAIIGFHSELGWVNHEKGNIGSAANEFEKFLKYLESFPDHSYNLFHIFRLRFGHMLAWVAHFLGRRKELTEEGQAQDYKRPSCGMFANLEDPPSEGISRQAVPLVVNWAMLASYVAWSLPRERVRAWADLGRARTPAGQYQSAVWISWDAVFANDLSVCDLNAALHSGFEYIGCTILAEQMRENCEALDPTNIYGDFENWRPQLSSQSLNKLGNGFLTFVIEPILMTLCSMTPSPSIDLTTWRQTLINILGEKER